MNSFQKYLSRILPVKKDNPLEENPVPKWKESQINFSFKHVLILLCLSLLLFFLVMILKS
jgi:hypothetical protein